MEKKVSNAEESEVRGIVISHGGRIQTEPRFSAYVWSEGPDAEVESSTKAA